MSRTGIWPIQGNRYISCRRNHFATWTSLQIGGLVTGLPGCLQLHLG